MRAERQLLINSPEENFWNLYQELRIRKMPCESGLYPRLEKIYCKVRLDFHARYEEFFDRALPIQAIKVYNEIFSIAQETVENVLGRHPVSQRAHRLAIAAFAIRIQPGDTFSDLLKLDVFADKTCNQDILPELVFGDIAKTFRRNPVLASDTLHFFFHRPQKSQHIFFHEIIVGYLLNEVENGGKVPTASTLPLMDKSYSPLAAFALERLAKLLNKHPAQLVALHFEDNSTVTSRLPPFAQELMLVSSHIYWYFDLYAKMARRHSPATLLAFIYNFFLTPCIDRQIKEKRLRLIPNAGRWIDQVFLESLLNLPKSEMDQLTEIHIVRLLMRCVENVWWTKGNA